MDRFEHLNPRKIHDHKGHQVWVLTSGAEKYEKQVLVICDMVSKRYYPINMDGADNDFINEASIFGNYNVNKIKS